MNAVLEAYPEAADKRNGYYWNLPLHLALEHGYASPICLRLFETYPGAARAENRDGDMPLHWAVEFNAVPEIVKQVGKTPARTILTASAWRVFCRFRSYDRKRLS